MAKKLIRITDKDNVAVALSPIVKGDVLNIDNLTITATMDITAGHKISLFDIKKGEPVIKYGYPIGYAKEDIPVHLVYFFVPSLLPGIHNAKHWRNLCLERLRCFVLFFRF